MLPWLLTACAAPTPAPRPRPPPLTAAPVVSSDATRVDFVFETGSCWGQSLETRTVELAGHVRIGGRDRPPDATRSRAWWETTRRLLNGGLAAATARDPRRGCYQAPNFICGFHLVVEGPRGRETFDGCCRPGGGVENPPPPPTNGEGGQISAELAAALARLDAAIARVEAAQASGNFAEYGAALAELQAAMDAVQQARAASPAPSGSPTPTPSP